MQLLRLPINKAQLAGFDALVCSTFCVSIQQFLLSWGALTAKLVPVPPPAWGVPTRLSPLWGDAKVSVETMNTMALGHNHSQGLMLS